MNHDLVGKWLGKYEIRAEIGRGGMSIVYKGHDPALDRPVAVKVLAAHLAWREEFVERFLREARAAARLEHRNIVTIYNIGQEGDCYYFVMQYLEGQPLDEIMRQRGVLSPQEVLSTLRPVAGALDYAHHRGLVHRDIKPGNIVLHPAGEVTLTDFGIVRATKEARLTATGTIVGTPEYMSPEQARGLSVGRRSDQYSLAVVAYKMLSGEAPYQAQSTLALLHKIVYEPLPSIRQLRPELPIGVERAFRKALAKDPGDRYETVTAFVDALERAFVGEPVVEDRTRIVPAGGDASAKGAAQSRPRRSVIANAVSQWLSPLQYVPGWGWAVGGLAVMIIAMGMIGILAIGGSTGDATPTAPTMERATLTVPGAGVTETAEASPSPEATATATETPSSSPTKTPTETATPSPSPTSVVTATSRQVPTATFTPIPPTSTSVPPTQEPAEPTEPPSQPTEPPTPPPSEPTEPPSPPPTEPPPPPPTEPAPPPPTEPPG